MPATVTAARERVLLQRDELQLEIKLQPLRIHLRRDGYRLLRGLHVWTCEGEVQDRFITVTEGVIAQERRGFPERSTSAAVTERLSDGVVLALQLAGGRHAELRLTLPGRGELLAELSADDDPLRVALEWDLRSEERFNGLGAHHEQTVDHRERSVQLGAARRYTGPDCPPDMLEAGGFPQGDYAPAPWLQSSRGYAVWCETYGNGTRFDIGGARGRTSVSVRGRSGPLVARFYTDPSPAARLRRYLRATGLPPVLAEWGYGFWKSRDVYEHQEDVLEDMQGCRWHGVPLDAVVLDSPWETQYNTWIPNPHQFPDFAGMVARMRAAGVRTVVWVTPWTNLDSLEGQIPPDPGSRRLHSAPASNYADGVRAGAFVKDAAGEPYVARWWMGTGSPVDFTSEEGELWWREQAKDALRLGVEGIKADDGEGYYFPDDVRFADGSTGAESAWRMGGLYRRSMQRALDDVWGEGNGVLFGRSGWSGQQATGSLWAGDQFSDFWSLRTLVGCTIAAAASGFSNWSHDVGGYLGEGGMRRASKELLLRWVQLGCFTPLMQAHGRLQQEPWTYDPHTMDVYRAYVQLHERLVPYVRAAAATCARSGLPIVRPAALVDRHEDRGWAVADAFGYGPSLWVAPVVEDGAREREAYLPPGRWVAAWSGETVTGGREVVAPCPLDVIPVWVRHGALIVTYPLEHVTTGLGDMPELQRPLEATLWGVPRCGQAGARLADGTRLTWRRGRGLQVRGPATRDIVLDVRE